MTPAIWLRWEVTLVEDLHAGTGLGRGDDIDAAHDRDRTGRPVVRGTHVKGLALEAARELVALEAAHQRDVDALFGVAGAASRATTFWPSLRVAESPERPFVVWGSSARQPGQRAPAEDTLRFVEHAGAGTTFHATFVVRDAGHVALLTQCLDRVDRLGAARSRGSGQITGSVKPITAPTRAGPGEPPPDHLRLRLLLRNLEPLCLPVTGNPVEQTPGECFVRGQVLRGAVLAWARMQDRRGASALAHRSICFTDALPLPPSGPVDVASLATIDVFPMPLHLGTPRHCPPESSWPWWAHTRVDDTLGARGEFDRFTARTAEKPKRPGGDEFLFRGAAGPWRRFHPDTGTHLRNTPSRKPGAEKTALYGEGEIAEDTCFVAEITFPDAASAEAARRLLDPLLTGADLLAVGRGGRAVRCEASCWLPPRAHPDVPVDGPFVLVLGSDLIVRDDWLGFEERLTPAVLARCVGWGPERLSELDNGGRDVFSDATEVRGFNAVSGLPRAVARAIRRGSSIRVGGADSGALRQALAECRRLGERTWEGFGAFRLDPAFTFAPAEEATVEPAAGDDLEALTREGLRLAAEMPERGGPARSQWQSLRQQLAVGVPLDVLTAFADRGGTRGGAAWAAVPWARLRGAVADRSPDDARLVLDVMIRRVILRMKTTTDAEGTP